MVQGKLFVEKQLQIHSLNTSYPVFVSTKRGLKFVFFTILPYLCIKLDIR